MSFAFGQATLFHLADIARFSRVMRTTGKSLQLVVLGADIHAGHRVLLRTAKQRGVAVVAVELVDEVGGHAVTSQNPEQHNPAAQHPAPQNPAPQQAVHDKPAELRPEIMEILREAEVDAVVPYTRAPGHAESLWPSLLHAVAPEPIIAGEKDYELLLRLQQAITDLHLDVKVQGVPTVRMPDGLAMSLRNTAIPETDREKALALSAALTAGAHVAEWGAEAVLSTAADVLRAAGVQPDYLELRARDFGPAPEEGDARLLVAATFGGVRLVDNVGVPVGIGFRNLDGDN